MKWLFAIAVAAGLSGLAAGQSTPSLQPVTASPVQPKLADAKEKAGGDQGATTVTARLLESFQTFRKQWMRSSDPVVYGRHLRVLHVGLQQFLDERKPPRPSDKPGVSEAKTPSVPQPGKPPVGEPAQPPPADQIRQYEERTAGTRRGPDVAALVRERFREQQYKAAVDALKKLDAVEAAVAAAAQKARADKNYDRVGATTQVVDDLGRSLSRLHKLAQDEAAAGRRPAGPPRQSSPPTELIP